MFPIRDYEEEEESLKTKLGEFSKIIVISRATKTSSRSKYKKGRVLTLLLLIRDDDEAEESLVAKLGGFSMIREFDKLSFLVKLDMVRSLDWTEGTW